MAACDRPEDSEPIDVDSEDTSIEVDTDTTGDTDTAPSADADGDGQRTDQGDCDDRDPDVLRGAADPPGDGLDSNCDGIDGGRPIGAEALANSHLAGPRLPSDGAWLGNNVGVKTIFLSDATGDGLDDIGSAGSTLFYDFEGPPGRLDPGVYIIAGTPHGEAEIDEASWASWHGEPGTAFGARLARGGDIDGDGRADLAIGAHQYRADEGFAGIYPSGSPGSFAWNDDAFMVRGANGSYASVLAWGDFDADSDGTADLLVYTWDELLVFADPTPQEAPAALTDADISIVAGYLAFDPFGRRSHDFDGDGHDDLLVISEADVSMRAGPFVTGVEAAPIFAITLPEYGNSNFSLGDVNGDGELDLAYGVASYPSAGEQSGTVGIFLGPLSGTRDFESADAWLDAEHANVGLSNGLSISGDLDGNGDDEIVVGAPGVYANHTGAVVVFADGWIGRRTTADADLVIDGSELGDEFGWSLATDGDLDGDGADDLVVGAPYEDHWRGGVWTFSGAALMAAIP